MEPQKQPPPKKSPPNGPETKPPPPAQAAPTPAAPAAPPAAEPRALVPVEQPMATGAIVKVGFDTVQGFEGLQRICKAFATSTLVPEQYRGNLANCVIAFEMANRMGASPLMVMQNLYIVHGNPSWASKFMIASFNQCGRFTAIKYRWFGEEGKSTWGCRAYATEKATGEEVEGPKVSMEIAALEGWIDRKGSKWKTMPQLMLTYRAAAFLIRTTAPELTMGLNTAEEAEDVGQVIGEEKPKGVAALSSIVKAKHAEIDVKPEPEPSHDPATGEVHEAAPAGEEQPPDGPTETIDPTAPAGAPAPAK